LDRIAALPPALLIGVASAAFVLLSIFPLLGDSCVNDEIAHLPAGYSYWKKFDFRMNPEHPPLAKLLAGAPLQFLGLQWPQDETYWRKGEEWGFGYRLLYQSGNDADRMVFWGRLPMLIWGLLLLGSVYAVSRSLFGPRGALISLALATFCPEFLAHSHLVNTDAPIAATMFLTIVCFWKFSERPSWRWSLACGATLGLALAVKFSAVMLVPALLWFLAASFFGRKAGRPGWGMLLLFLGAIAAVSLSVIWASYGFRYRASPDPSWAFPWKQEWLAGSVIGKAVSVARSLRLLPEAYLYGFSYFHDQSQARHAFAMGIYSTEGWGWYFPFAFLVKTPTPHLVLYGWGLVASYRRIKNGDLRDQFLLVPLIIYWVLAIMSRMNIGVRHILPVVPLMIVLAGGIDLDSLRGSARVWKARGVLGLLTLSAAGVVLAAPYFLAYFNLPALLVREPHGILVDSNLDWGQDLARLKKYMDRHGIASVKLGYFGNASPRQLGLKHEQLPGSNMYKEVEPEWPVAEEFLPGDYVAISATNYVGLLIPERNFYLSRFGRLKPVAVIGHSILLFHLGER
jgi:hypothetical protein